MRSVLFIAFCILSFASTAFSALAFSRRLGRIPPGQEEPAVPSVLSATTLSAVSPFYTLQTDTHQVVLSLGPLRIKAEGINFIAVTFGFTKELLFPGDERPIQVGDFVGIILLGDGTNVNDVIDYVRNISSAGELLLSQYLRRTGFVLGFKIFYDAAPENSSLPVGKRRGEELIRPTKRQAIELVLSCNGLHTSQDRATLNMEGKTVHLVSSRGMSSEASAELEDRLLKLKVSSGAVAFVARNGVVDPQSFGDGVSPIDKTPVEVLLHVYPGDVVFLLVQTSDYNNLDTLSAVPELVQDIGTRWNPFVEQFCQDQVAVAAFTVQNKQ
jgi:hypothetical protein